MICDLRPSEDTHTTTATSSNTTTHQWTRDVTMSTFRKNRSYNGVDQSSTPSRRQGMDDITLPPPVVSPQLRSTRRTRPNLVVVGWNSFKNHLRSSSFLSTPSAYTTSEYLASSRTAHHSEKPEVTEPDEGVEKIVVDRDWSQVLDNAYVEDPTASRTTLNSAQGNNSDIESFSSQRRRKIWNMPGVLGGTWNFYPALVEFFSARYDDAATETRYSKEHWSMQKRLALWSSLFLIVNWILGCVFIPTPVTLLDKIFYYAASPVLTCPLFLMVAFNIPYTHSGLYQIYLCLSIWSWSFYQLLFMYRCGFYNQPYHSNCGTKDFFMTLYYTAALQTVALFGLEMKRFFALVGALAFFLTSSTTILPWQASWIRNAINFLFCQGFLTYMHYLHEKSARRTYTLRDQLEAQFKETRSAQVKEREAADSKRRLTSYVRAPLNTALLAVQNMAANRKSWKTIADSVLLKDQEIEFNALQESLGMMSKVLNDVLDFNRMDSGWFESFSKPFRFHRVMNSLLTTLRLTTDACNLDLVVDLDNRISQVARCAAHLAMGDKPDDIDAMLKDNPNGLGLVVGDESRLRQIITNLAENACKFTPDGGEVKISTRLVFPILAGHESKPQDVSTVLDGTPPSESPIPCITTEQLTRAGKIDHIVVRIEVTDTGIGIRRQDIVEGKLFSAFNQSQQGRLQGGKGTGLGLALVRQIVKGSGGRLGVKSKLGQGSTFWIELPLAIGASALSADDATPRESTSSSEETKAEYCPFDVPLQEAAGLDPRTIPLRPVLTRLQSDATLVSENSPQAPPQVKPTFIALPSPIVVADLDIISEDLGPAAPSPSLSVAPRKLPQLDVLVADDDPLTRMLMTRLLTRLGCNVSTAENGLIALEMMLGYTPVCMDGSTPGVAIHHDPDAVGHCAPPVSPEHAVKKEFAVCFLDNQMPVMSGLIAITKLRELGRKDYVVGVTGNAMLSDQKEYMKAGIDQVLTKPVFEKSLKIVLAIAAERRTAAIMQDQQQQ